MCFTSSGRVVGGRDAIGSSSRVAKTYYAIR